MSTPLDGAGTRRPPTVVAIAALAGLQALFCLLPGLNALSYGLAGSALIAALGAGFVLLSAACVQGAVQLVRGRSARVLLVVAVVLAVVWTAVVALSLVLGGGLDVLSLVFAALGVGIAVGLRRPDVRAWVGEPTPR